MKTLNRLMLLLAGLFIWSACDEDGDKYFLSSITSNELIASTDNVVLTEDQSQKNVLSLAWTDRTLAISSSDYKPTNLLKTTMQVSLQADFSGSVEESTETSLSKTYNTTELNMLSSNLGVEVDVPTKLYFRLRGVTGDNIAPAYSNVVEVTVTAFKLDTRFASILDQNSNNTGTVLFSSEDNGIYKGFVGVDAWFNFLVKDANGTIWRTDGETGAPFILSSAGDWKCWFPGVAGCYYVTFDTANKQWSGLSIPSLNVSGAIDAQLAYDKATRKWTASFNASTAGDIAIQINGKGKLYNHTTGTLNDNGGYDIDDSKAVETSVAFSGNSEALAFGTTASNISLHIPQAGDYTLTLDLSDSQIWTATVAQGAVEPEPEPELSQYLYLPGIGPDDSWTYDRKIELYYGDEQKYAGAVDVNSKWGNYVFSSTDFWEEGKMYTLANDDDASTAASGSLVKGAGKNITAPSTGLYLFEVSLKEMTYKTSPIGNEIYCYYGIEGDSNLYPLAATSTLGEFSGTITLPKKSTWGVKFYINDDWSGVYGGNEGKLYFDSNSGFALDAGTYLVTVNLIDGTYIVTQK